LNIRHLTRIWPSENEADFRTPALKLPAFSDNEADFEIKLRAIAQIGKLSRELEKAEAHGRGEVSLPSTGKRKSEQLAPAGIGTTTAHR
jgi:hypothetical protein